MGDHYIPRYYLKGFVSSTDGIIWTYEKNGRKIFKSNVGKTGCENEFYRPDIEAFLSNDIENPANAVIDKIRNREKLSDYDKIILSTYMVAMLKRVPQGKIIINELAPNVAQETKDEFDFQISELIRSYPEKADLLEKKRKEIADTLNKYAIDPPKDFWLDLINPSRTPNVIKLLQMMTWTFLTVDDYPAFLTCDNPIYYFPWMGMGQPNSEVTFPISSNIALLASWSRNIIDGYYPVKAQSAREVNRRTASNATRFVYHCRQEKWIHKFINKPNHRIHKLIN